MGKIICEVCGTSYSEAAAQCPICGCVRPVGTQVVSEESNQAPTETKYQYVKGGRFSKANVRKRNNKKKTEAKPKAPPVEEEKNDKSSNKGLVITILVLLLAIIAVIVYIAITFFGPTIFPDNNVEDTKPSESIAEPSDLDLSCTDIQLESSGITIEIGTSVQLMPVLTPVDTTDECTYSTNNDAVATVMADGTVTAVGSGEAVITVSCGNVSATCTVIVPEPAVPFELNREDITFTKEGDEWLIYTGTLPVNEIVWASDDEMVATIENGKIIAVGNGVTTIYGNYNGETLSCVVRCEFEGATEDPTEESDPTDATFVDNGPYQLKNIFGISNSDVTIGIGESFVLVLIDKNGDKVSGVTWTVEDGSCCSVTDGEVLGVAVGQAKVVATFNGESYSCIVRVA